MKILPIHGEVAARRADGGGYRFMRRPETYTARRLRRTMTLPEVLLWQQLKANDSGLRFRRQHPIGPYVADLYCAAARLVIEIDGAAHDMGTRPARDEVRNRTLEEKGYNLVRLPASDVLNDPAAAAEAVVRAAAPLRQPLRDCPLLPLCDNAFGSPASGEDQ